jgi:cell division protein FtsL
MSTTTRQIAARPRRIRIPSGTPKGRAAHISSNPADQKSLFPVAPAGARRFIRRWITAGMLLVAAALAVVYVSNAIAVNKLLSEITSLERERDAVRGDNERLRAELLRLMSVERVTTLATEQLGMVQPARPPIALPLRDGGRKQQTTTDREE